MIREKRILSYILGWFLLGYIIFFIGINNVKADTFNYENIGLVSDYTIFYVTDDNPSGAPTQLQQYQTYNLQNVTQLLLYIENYNFDASVVYDLEVYMPLNSIKNNTTFIVTDQNYNMCTTYEVFVEDSSYPRFRFSCSQNTNYISMTIFNDASNYVIDNGNFSWNYTFLRKQVSSVDLGPIIDSNNQIIQGQEEIKDTIKNELNSCRDSYNLFELRDYSYSILNSNKTTGTITLNGFVDYNESIRVGTAYLEVGKDYYFSFNNVGDIYISYFLTSKNGRNIILNKNGLFRVQETSDYTMNFVLTSGTYDNVVIKPMINLGITPKDFEPYGEEICSNKLDETNDKLDNIEGALTDSSPTDMSVLGDTAGWLPPGPVDSIINLPLTFFLNLSQSLTSECRPVSLPLPYVNKNIELPCMNSVYEKIGITGFSGFFTWVGLICSAVILFNYLLDLYHWVDKTLTMRENTMPGYYEDKWGGGA